MKIAALQTRGSGRSTIRLCLWLLRYGLRRRTGMLAMLAPMLLKIGLDLLKPWPVKLLVDNVLDSKPIPSQVGQALAVVGVPITRDGLLALAVTGTVLLFLAGWVTGLAN